MKVCGLNDCFQLGEKSNYKHSSGKHAISQPRKSHINVASVLSFSTFYDHSVWITENGQAFAIGDNNYNQISKTLSKKTFEQDTEILIKDNNDQQYKFVSAVCSNDFTIYLVSSQSDKDENNKIYYSLANQNSLFLNIGDTNPVALFGGHSAAAIIDNEGSIYIVTKSTLSLPDKKIDALSLPDGEILIKISFCDDIIIALSSTGRLFEYNISQNKSSTFSEVSELKNFSIVDISGSTSHCFAVTENGQVFGLGSNEHCKLGFDKKTTKVTIFTKIESLNGYKIVSAFAGSSHSIFKTSRRKIIGCGGNVNGQLMLKSGPSKKAVFPPIEISIEDDEITFCIAGNETTVIFTNNKIPVNMSNRKVSIEYVKVKSNDEKTQKSIETSSDENKSDVTFSNENKSIETISDEKEQKSNEFLSDEKKSTEISSDEKVSKSSETFFDDKTLKSNENLSDGKKSIEISSIEVKRVETSSNERTLKSSEFISDEKKSTGILSDEIKREDSSSDEKNTQKSFEISSDYKDQDLKELLRKTREELEKVKKENIFLHKKEEADKQRISHLEEELEKYRRLSMNSRYFDSNFQFDELEKIKTIKCEPSSQVFEVIKKEHFILEVFDPSENGFDINQINKIFKNHETANQLNNPSIIKSLWFDYSGTYNQHSILYEYCPTNLKRKVKKLQNSEKISVIIDLCHALKEIHSIGIIHGNLKLENVFLDFENHPKISEFGLGKVNLDVMSPSQKIKALKFLAPEQINRKDKCDEKVDVYAFGVVVYMILTGGEYPCIDSDEIAVGKMAEIPETITPFSGNLIKKCWTFNSSKRPSFDEIYNLLKNNENEIIYVNE